MTELLPWLGLSLLLLVGVGVVFTGIPAAVVPSPAAPVVSGFALGALLGPMNGSVGASVLALSRVAEPRLGHTR